VIRLLLDEHVPPYLIPALKAREPTLDVVRVQDVGLRAAPDPVLLDWAFAETRVLISRDRKTLIRDAYDRLSRGLSFAGRVIYDETISPAGLLDDILLIDQAYDSDDVRDQVLYLPL
jgi:hypothetical protein